MKMMHTSGVFSWSREALEGLPEFFQDLHRHGQRGALVLTPGVQKESGDSPYSRGSSRGVFIKHADSDEEEIIDFEGQVIWRRTFLK